MERTTTEQRTTVASTTQSAAAKVRLSTDRPTTIDLIPKSQPEDLDPLLARAPLYNDWDEA